VTASSLQVTPGSGLRLATNSYTEGAVTVHDQKTILGEPYTPLYYASLTSTSVATLDAHFFQLMAGASLVVRIQRIWIKQNVLAGAAATCVFQLLRLTTAGTGGTVVTPSAADTADGASGATFMALPTAKGTESTILWRAIPLALAGAAPVTRDSEFEWVSPPNTKGIKIAAGTTNGVALKVTGNIATATAACVVDFTESSF